jgi:hypothetical protein
MNYRRITIGVVAGWILWLALVCTAIAMEALEPRFPRWVVDADLPDTIGGVCRVAAWPIAVGGWQFIWGDGPQSPSWVTSLPFNVLVGLVLYGSIGMFIGAVYDRLKKQKKA